ncbi:hypothetical protein [Spongiactinospora sp. 9N601]|uniref:hypothetical protein n=1 Tax=Spongiactinospora sp. 9N601 TaxID=3375149 RepID=UPI00379B5E5E
MEDERRAPADDLRRLVGGRSLDPLEILFEAGPEGGRLRALLADHSATWADVLLGDDDEAAELPAIRLIAALYPGDAPFDPRRAGGRPRWAARSPGGPVTRARRPSRPRSPPRCSASPARAYTTWYVGASSTATPPGRSPPPPSAPGRPGSGGFAAKVRRVRVQRCELDRDATGSVTTASIRARPARIGRVRG